MRRRPICAKLCPTIESASRLSLIRIGLNTSEVLTGLVGGLGDKDYTVILHEELGQCDGLNADLCAMSRTHPALGETTDAVARSTPYFENVSVHREAVQEASCSDVTLGK